MLKNDNSGGIESLCRDQARFFQVFRVLDGWMALAKEEPFSGVNDPVNEAGDLWYAFGDSYDDALSRLRLELRRQGVVYTEGVV